MRTKLAEIKGPYPCTKMDSENPGVCPSCPHWGKITNPLLFGRDMAVTTVESVVELPRVSMDEEVKKVLRPEAPRGYAYGERGGIFIQKEDEDAQGNKVMRSVLIIPYDLFPVDILSHNGEHTVHFMAIRREGVQNITMAQKAVVSQDETVKALANQNIVASFGRGNDKNLFDYVRASVEKMSTTSRPSKYRPTTAGKRIVLLFTLVKYTVPHPRLWKCRCPALRTSWPTPNPRARSRTG